MIFKVPSNPNHSLILTVYFHQKRREILLALLSLQCSEQLSSSEVALQITIQCQRGPRRIKSETDILKTQFAKT